MFLLVSWVLCVLWYGHDAVVVQARMDDRDTVYCQRCGSLQGLRGWWNVGTFRRLRR